MADLVHFTIEGADEFRAALRSLPADLAAEGNGIVVDAANAAKEAIASAYPTRTGNLKRGLGVTIERSAFGTRAIVKNKAHHAYIFENGTEARHTDLGADRGSMPAGHVFIPEMIRRRRGMAAPLIALLRRAGLVVA